MALLDTCCDFSAPVFRNIASLRQSVNLFDDLLPDARAQDVAVVAVMRGRQVPQGVIDRGLAYSEAMNYPFESDICAASRFGDGSIRVWYGARDSDTALAETCYHQSMTLRGTEGSDRGATRYRRVW